MAIPLSGLRAHSELGVGSSWLKVQGCLLHHAHEIWHQTRHVYQAVEGVDQCPQVEDHGPAPSGTHQGLYREVFLLPLEID